MEHRLSSFVVGAIVVLMSGHPIAQAQSGGAPPPGVAPPTPVTGSGTPGTLPLWTGSGQSLADSHVQDSGTSLTVTEPISGTIVVNGTINAFNSMKHALQGYTSEPNAVGVVGGNTATTSGGGVGVFGVVASSNGTGVAVYGEARGSQGVGVHGSGASRGVIGTNEQCDDIGCTPTAGVAGVFNTLAGGTILRGNQMDLSGQRTNVFTVDSGGGIFGAGDITINGNAYKPGGGSWSTLSDVRTKQSIEPISGALHRLLQLRGVSYEYTNPSAFGELPGRHIGMVAQEVERVFPSWVDTGTDGYKRLTFRGFEAVAVEAVRELDARSNDATARISDLERENAELRHAIEALSETVKAIQQKESLVRQ